MKQKMISKLHSNKLRETLATLGVEKIEFIPTGNGDVHVNNGMTVQIRYVYAQVWSLLMTELRIKPLLRDKGIKVLEITGSELVRGRGPRCMSQPLFREDI